MPNKLVFYRTARGDEPVLDYIRAQTKPHRTKIGRALQYLEDVGHLARRPIVDYLGRGLYELRAGFEGHQHRMLYFFHGTTVIVVASAFLKKEDAVPTAQLTRAGRYRADWIVRFGGKS